MRNQILISYLMMIDDTGSSWIGSDDAICLDPNPESLESRDPSMKEKCLVEGISIPLLADDDDSAPAVEYPWKGNCGGRDPESLGSSGELAEKISPSSPIPRALLGGNIVSLFTNTSSTQLFKCDCCFLPFFLFRWNYDTCSCILLPHSFEKLQNFFISFT